MAELGIFGLAKSAGLHAPAPPQKSNKPKSAAAQPAPQKKRKVGLNNRL